MTTQDFDESRDEEDEADLRFQIPAPGTPEEHEFVIRMQKAFIDRARYLLRRVFPTARLYAETSTVVFHGIVFAMQSAREGKIKSESHFGNAVRTIMKRFLINTQKKANRAKRDGMHISSVSEEQNFEFPENSKDRLATEMVSAAREHFEKVEPDAATVLTLYLGGFSYREIASTMKCNRSNVARLFNKIRQYMNSQQSDII